MGSERKRYLPVFAVMLILSACSTQEHFHTLSFFFDGVPNPDDEKLVVLSDSLLTVNSDSATIPGKAILPYFTHQPYLEKQCSSCHNKGQMGSLNESQPGLCYQCHTNIQSTYNYEHGPAVAGYCTECHDSHKAKNENLLKQVSEDLCFRCHNISKISENMFHNISTETNCAACHNPHGSNNHSLLHQGTCYLCHDNFEDSYTVIHGPVASGLCSECHTSHAKGLGKLLKKKGQDLCIYCHDSERLLGDDTHAYIEDSNCTECHNPHGGEDRFMFK